MGKPNKNVPNVLKQRHPKSKKHKTEVVFDDKARVEYLTGFSKRKTQRKKKAHEELIASLKEEKKRIREKRRERYQAQVEEYRAAGIDIPEPIMNSKIFELPQHTVTVTEVVDLDLADQKGLMLGKNKDMGEDETEEMEDGDKSDSDEDTEEKKDLSQGEKIKVNTKKLVRLEQKTMGSKHGKNQRHKKYTHAMDKKILKKKKQKPFVECVRKTGNKRRKK